MLDDAREEAVSQTGNGEPGTTEAEALAAALNHSAERVQTLWFSFLTFMLYLTIATGTTTHRMLFLESPLNLPVLNIPLPLFAFYILTPLIFIVFHFYMLLNLVLLARTAKAFEDALGRAFREDGEARENFRMRIENTLFAQLLVGGKLERKGINADLLSLMALITLALAPVALMLMFEVKFLPYHSEAITWLHRGLLAFDLALVWTIWPAYRSGWGVRLRPKATWRLVMPGIGSAVALAYAVAVATFPDERMYLATHWLHGESHWDFSTDRFKSHDRPNWYDMIAPINTLSLRSEDLIDDAKLGHILEKNEGSTGTNRWVATLSLAGRDLTGANLSHADVRHVDFSGAILNRAQLSFAWAKNAHFDATTYQGEMTQLHDTLLDSAQLQGASFFRAQLQGARLGGAQLQGALLVEAQLQGASLSEAELQGASLEKAQLSGASLTEAQLQGASLDQATLQGASLDGAQLQGASLYEAELQGASLDKARLQGASLNKARLQGASLEGVQLQGASLYEAELQGASFADVCAWRADAREAFWKDTMVAHLETGAKADTMHECDWTAASFAELKQLIAKEVPQGDTTRAATEMIEQSLDPTKPLEGEKEMAKIWAARERETPAPEVYEKSLAEQWRKTGCAAEEAPYVLHGLVDQLSNNSPFSEQSDVAKALAFAFLDEAHCAGAHGLSEDDKTRLKAIAGPAAPQAPKP